MSKRKKTICYNLQSSSYTIYFTCRKRTLICVRWSTRSGNSVWTLRSRSVWSRWSSWRRPAGWRRISSYSTNSPVKGSFTPSDRECEIFVMLQINCENFFFFDIDFGNHFVKMVVLNIPESVCWRFCVRFAWTTLNAEYTPADPNIDTNTDVKNKWASNRLYRYRNRCLWQIVKVGIVLCDQAIREMCK